MIYQMEHLDLSSLIKEGDQAVLNSMAARTKNKGLQFRADVMRKQITDKKLKETNEEPISLNDFINFIELTLNLPYSLSPTSMSASRGYSLFYQAKKKIEAIKKRNKPNVNN